jgi:hypothetical protein
MKHVHVKKPLTLRAETLRQLSQAADRELRQVRGGKPQESAESAFGITCSNACSGPCVAV